MTRTTRATGQTGGKASRLRFKACRKCGGDVYLDRDAYGVFQTCLQCGRMVDLAVNPVLADREAPEKLAA